MIDYSRIKFYNLLEVFHVYYVPNLHDELLKYLPQIEEEHFIHRDSRKGNGIGNTIVGIEEVIQIVKGVNDYITEKYYSFGERFGDGRNVGLYWQDNSINTSIRHTHYKAGIISTIYLNPPPFGQGGELEIYLPPSEPISFKVQKDFVYIIPGWLIHRPLPQLNNQPRICLNWNLDTSGRIVNKFTGDKW